jgi:hypothetical protein
VRGVVLWFVGCAALIAGILHTRFHGGAWRRIRMTSPAPAGLYQAAH